MTTHRYTFAVLGLPVPVKGATLAAARRALLRRYAHSVTLRHPWLPVCPTLVLLSTTDSRALSALHDERLKPPPEPKYRPSVVVSIC